MVRVRLLLAFLLTLAAAGPAGCAAPGAEVAPDPFARFPADLTIDLTVLTGHGAPAAAEAHLRPGRVIVFPDGSLHYSDENVRHQRVPGKTRRLDRGQMSEIWTLARSLGLADADQADAPVNLNTLRPARGERLYLLEITGEGRRWNFIHRRDAADEPDPAIAQFTRRLTQLAWATDMPESRVIVIPQRRDFGPDPYARYRE